MRIALIGYGKMGREIEELAISKDHTIGLKISIDNLEDFTSENLNLCDVAIEFSSPEAAEKNLNKCFDAGVPVVCGTTGWYQNLERVMAKCAEHKGALLYSSNFSIGVNIFFAANRYLARLLNKYPEYNISIEEIHHTQKLDSPSGTAITLAEQTISLIERKKNWELSNTIKSDSNRSESIEISALRMEDVKGTHTIKYQSEIDTIELKHEAHSRKGFAAGAILAAEFIFNKQGIFTMKDVLNLG